MILIAFIYNIASDIIYAVLKILYFFTPNTIKVSQRLACRLPKLKGNQSIWVHGASVGEVLSAKALINKLQEQYMNYDIIITTHT